jgi:tryptophanyl-tRNA synthetase
MNKTILSGVQPSGDMHIGNYLGALKDFVELQKKYKCYFFIADLHSISEDYDPKEKSNQILETFISFLAVGLDPKKTTLFIQSQVPAHTELSWIFSTLTSMSELERMTQYKDKAGRQATNINAGLFTYPVLQAADILLYKPAMVPVGQDQIQHLELTNSIVRKFNHKYGKCFTEVGSYMQKPVRVMSLSNPDKKMSKSEPNSYVGMFDEPDVINRKLAKAVTATDAPKGQMPQGVQNLFGLLSEFGDKATYKKHMDAYNDGNIRYSDLKSDLADAIAKYFAPIRKKRKELLKNKKAVLKMMTDGSKQAERVANKTLAKVKKKIGLI